MGEGLIVWQRSRSGDENDHGSLDAGWNAAEEAAFQKKKVEGFPLKEATIKPKARVP